MASEEIKLIGSFKDDITPQLKKLNKQIDAIGRSFSKFSRNLRPMSREFGRMAMASKSFNETLKTQRSLLQSNANAMRQYKSQAGKMVSAMRAVQSEQAKMMRAQGMSRAEQKRAARASSRGGGRLPGMPAPAAPVIAPRAPKMPKAPRVPAAPPVTMAPSAAPARAPSIPKPAKAPTAPKFDASKLLGIGKQMGGQFANTVMGSAIGTSIGMMASNAMMRGIDMMSNALMKPFKWFVGAIGERIGDEMDDIKSAGGLFALDIDLTQESGNERFFKNYNEALQYQERLNMEMANSAASLPGVTSQYVDMSRRLTDTLQMTMDADRKGFAKLAGDFGADLSKTGVEGDKEAFATVLKKQTEQLMLFSQGQQGGLPMDLAIQQLMGKEKGKIGMQGFLNKYRAAFQKNPLLKNFLLRAEADLANTEKGSVERLKILMETFEKALPVEVVNKMRESMSGMGEALRSGIFDPQGGFLGLSRAVQKNGKFLQKKAVDDFGNNLFVLSKDLEIGGELFKKGSRVTKKQLTDAGETIKSATDGFATDNTYLFEAIRETLSGFAVPLLEFVGFLPGFFDPFYEMTAILMDGENNLRDQAMKFKSVFNGLVNGFEDIAQAMSAPEGEEFKELRNAGGKLKKQARTRAALRTVGDFLGSLDPSLQGLQEEVANALKVEGTDAQKIAAVENFSGLDLAKRLMEELVQSSFIKEVANTFGKFVGEGIKSIFTMILGASDAMGGPSIVNDLFQEVIKGFFSAFGDDPADAQAAFNDMLARSLKVIEDALGTALEFGFKMAIPAISFLLKTAVGALWESGGIGKAIIAGIGLWGFSTIAGPILTFGQALAKMPPVMTAFRAAMTAMSTPIASIKAAIAGLTPLFGALGTVFTTILAPIAAVAGAIMLLVAVFRHADFIFSSILEAVKIVGNLIGLAGIELVKALTMIPRAILGMLDGLPDWAKNMIPGLNTILDGAKAFEKGLDNASASMVENIKDSGKKIAQNTTDSFARTQADAAKLNEMVFGAKKEEVAASKEAAAAITKLRDTAKAVGSTFENNKKFKGEDGKFYGWAKKDGKDVIVEWGSVASSVIKEVGDASKEAIAKQTEATKKLQAEQALEVEVDNGVVEVGGGMDAETAALMNKLRGVTPEETPTAAAPKRSDFGSGRSGAAEYNKAMREFKATQQPQSPATQTADPVGASAAIDKVESGTGIEPTAATTAEPEHKVYEFKSVNDGIQEVAGILNSIYDCLKDPEVTPIEPAPASEETNPLKKVFDNTILGAGINLLGNIFGGGGDGETTAPAAPGTAMPTPEETGVASVVANTEAVIEPIAGTYQCLVELKQPLMELPVQMSEALSLQTMELGTIIGTYLMETNAMLQTVANALAQSKEDTVVVKKALEPIRVVGNFGGGGKTSDASKGWFPMYKGNVYSAAGGMNLGAAISEEMRNKPAGSDLVIANSAETIIPPDMKFNTAFAGMNTGTMMMPSDMMLESGPASNTSSTSTSSEIKFGDINVTVSGVDDPKEIANQVADEILDAIQRSSYDELFTN